MGQKDGTGVQSAKSSGKGSAKQLCLGRNCDYKRELKRLQIAGDRESQPAHLPGGGAGHAYGQEKDAVIFSALCGAFTKRVRDGDLRPELVQPSRSRARNGVLRRERKPGISAQLPGI
jgi:hypothetical protein